MGGNGLAVPQDGDPVADLLQLLKAVGNIDDRHAVLLQIADDFKQHLNLVFAQGRRRLIHNQHTGVLGEGLRDFHQLLLGHAQILDLVLGGDVCPQEFQEGVCFLRHFLKIDVSVLPSGFPVQIHILRHRQLRN